jgi:hypothetical protein
MTRMRRLVSLLVILALALTFTAMLPLPAHAAPAHAASSCVKNCILMPIDCLTASASFRPRDTNVATLSAR